MRERWPLAALAAGLCLGVLSQCVLIYLRDLAWAGGLGGAVAVVLFVVSLVWSSRRVLLRRSSNRPAWRFLAVVVAAGLVVVAAYLAHTGLPATRDYRCAVLLWGAGVVLAVLALLRPRDLRRWLPRVGRGEAVGVGLLLAVALALRLVGLGVFPDVMSGDEGEFALEARNILAGDLSNPFGTGWYANTNGYFYLQAAALRLLGLNLFALRLPTALLGALAVVAVYLLARVTFGRETAWVSSLFMAGWSFTLHFSRLAFSNGADPFFGALALAFLQRGLLGGRQMDFVAAGLVLGGSLYSYVGARLLVLVVLAVLFFSGARRLRRRWRGLLAFAVVWLLVTGPLLAYFARFPQVFFERHGYVGLFQSGQLMLERMMTGEPVWWLLLEHLGVTASVFTYTLDMGWFYRAAIPMLYLLSGALFLLGVGLAAARWREVRYKVLLTWIGLTVVLAGWLLKLPPHYDRYLVAAPAVALLVGRAGAVALRRTAQLCGWRGATRRRLTMILAAALLAVNAGYYIGVYVPSGSFYWDRNTVIADRTARLMASLGPGYVTYFFGTTLMPLSAFDASVSFLAPEAEWVDVLESPPADWGFVQKGRGALFVVIPERERDLPLLRARFPGGEERQVLGRRGEVVFTTYRIDPEGR